MTKKLVVVLLACMLMVTPSTLVMAQISSNCIENNLQDDNNMPFFRADVIIAKYRIHNNRLQYRRWNNTRRYWVDSYWIYM